MAVLILESVISTLTSTLYVDIGGLLPRDVLTLAADLNRRFTLVGVVEGSWQRAPMDLRELFPLALVFQANLWRFAKASFTLKSALLVAWEKELLAANEAWQPLLRPKLEKARKAMMEGVDPNTWS